MWQSCDLKNGDAQNTRYQHSRTSANTSKFCSIRKIFQQEVALKSEIGFPMLDVISQSNIPLVVIDFAFRSHNFFVSLQIKLEFQSCIILFTSRKAQHSTLPLNQKLLTWKQKSKRGTLCFYTTKPCSLFEFTVNEET